MAIGPMQLLVLGVSHPDFHGEIIAELERLRARGTGRVLDSLTVYKSADGGLEVEHLSNLSEHQAIELGSKVGALIGLGRDAVARAGGVRLSDGFISPLGLAEIGLMSAEDAKELHDNETADAAG